VPALNVGPKGQPKKQGKEISQDIKGLTSPGKGETAPRTTKGK